MGNELQKSTQEIIEYLRVAYAQEVLWHKLLDRLEIIRENAPRLQEAIRPVEPNIENTKDNSLSMTFSEFFSTPGKIIMIILFVVFFWIMGDYMVIDSGTALVYSVVLAILVYAVLRFIGWKRYFKDKSREALDKRAAFYNELQKAEQLQKQYDQQYQLQLSKWNQLKTITLNQTDECRRVLDALYDDQIIYKDYQNIVAISALLKYFESGRYSVLGEAYNQYELEYRLDQIGVGVNEINSKLDVALSRLTNITGLLQTSIEENRKQNDSFKTSMSSYLDKIAQNQQEQSSSLESIASSQDVLAKNTEVLKYITNHQHRNVDVGVLGKYIDNQYIYR